MSTRIGMNIEFDTVLKNLIHLDSDAADACEEALGRLDNPEFRRKLGEMRGEHLRHVDELSAVANEIGLHPQADPDMKVALAKEKLIMADSNGDKGVLMAINGLKKDTITAYERVSSHKDIAPQAREVLEKGLADERRHKAWIDEVIRNGEPAASG